MNVRKFTECDEVCSFSIAFVRETLLCPNKMNLFDRSKWKINKGILWLKIGYSFWSLGKKL